MFQKKWISARWSKQIWKTAQKQSRNKYKIKQSAFQNEAKKYINKQVCMSVETWPNNAPNFGPKELENEQKRIGLSKWPSLNKNKGKQNGSKIAPEGAHIGAQKVRT